MAVLAIAIMGCKKDTDNSGGDNPPTVNMQEVVLQGIVTDVNNKPLSGVQVITGSTTITTTDSDGRFIITKVGVVNKRAVLKFEKQGYFTLTRSGIKKNEMFIEAVLHPKGNSDISVQKSFNTETATTLEVSGMKVDIPSSSIMKADGSAYSGAVKADMLYLNPDNEKFSTMMPGGDLAGIRENGSESMLISYGMSDVTFTDNAGNPLQLKSGTSAKVTFPVPESMKNNPPASMPLWSFDEEKGTWIEEGVFTLEGNVYVGMATHFSWINCDDPEPPTDVWGLVVDCNNDPIPNIEVFSGQTSIRTNSKGEYSGKLPANTPTTLSVTLFGVTVTQNIPGYSEGTNNKLPDFKMPCGVKIKGKVLDCENRPIVSVKVSTEVTATYTDSKGEYLLLIPPQTPVTVSVNVGGEAKSEHVSGKPAGEVVILENFVMCEGGSEPGTYTKTEKGAVKLRMSSDDSDSFMAFTWDNNGRRFRMDMFNNGEDNISVLAYVLDHINKKFFYGFNDGGSGTWTPQEYDPSSNPAGMAFAIDEEEMAPYRVYPDVNIAGKVCKVFKYSQSGYEYSYASWNGILMRVEYLGEQLFIAVSATLDVPNNAFSQTFNVSWIP